VGVGFFLRLCGRGSLAGRNSIDKRTSGHIVRYDRARASACIVAQCNRSHQHRITAQKHTFSDHALVFLAPVIIAGDRAGPDIDAGIDLGITG
jgi:hypothetical protein